MTSRGIRGVTTDRYIAANQDIYCGEEIVFDMKEANGYGYDETNEDEKKCDDTIRMKVKTIVYEKPSIQSKQIAVLEIGNIVKRTHKSVREVDGHVWDKISLADGTKGYIFSDSVEKETIYENLKFKFNENSYNVYFVPSRYGLELKDYPYYLIGVDEETSNITICYSKTQITADSMPEVERIIKWESLQIAHGEIYTASVAATLAGYPNGGSALIYYLSSGNTGSTGEVYVYEEGIYTKGHTMRKISLENAINENSNMKEKLDKTIENVKEVAKKFNIPENSSITFYNTIEDSGITGTYKDKIFDGMDWFLAIGKYSIKIQCTVTKDNDNYLMEMKYGLRDYYDWKDSKEEEAYLEMIGTLNFKGILFETLEDLHKAGLARNYTNYGQIFYTESWNTN